MSLIKCPACGEELPEGSKFCIFCGKNIESGTDREQTGRSEPDSEDGNVTVLAESRVQDNAAINPQQFRPVEAPQPAQSLQSVEVKSADEHQPEPQGVPQPAQPFPGAGVPQPGQTFRPEGIDRMDRTYLLDGMVQPEQPFLRDGFSQSDQTLRPGGMPQPGQPYQPWGVQQPGQSFQPGQPYQSWSVTQPGQPYQQGTARSQKAPKAPGKKKSGKKLWIILASSVGGVLLAVGLTLLFIFVIQPDMKYNDAKTALEEQRFDDAYNAFTELDDYKDSQDMAKETLYQKGIYLLKNKKFKESMSVFEELGDYSDSREQYQNAYYTYGMDLLENGSYQDAADVFNYLDDYSDSREQYKLAYYNYGKELIDEESFESAIDVFESLGSYSDSEKQIKKAKYGYVLSHQDNTDLTTYEYLLELKEANYEASKKIYSTLYAWKITKIHFNTSEDNSQTKKSISKYDPVYCHFELTGGTPDGSTYIFCKATWPDGSDLGQNRSSESFMAGNTIWWAWEDGIYTNPEYGRTGTFSLVFYDEDNNVIGKGSVKIVD